MSSPRAGSARRSFEVKPVSDNVNDFIDWLNACCTPFHVVEESKRRLLAAGFEEVDERESFELQQSGKYFFTRNMSSIVAFTIGGAFKAGNGFVVVGAHTDSPCPKLKPISKSSGSGYLKLGTQPYGGGLWHTWFDRDLTIAGRLIVKRGDGHFTHELVRIERPICRIPTLAIHLSKAEERTSFAPNLQSNFYPVLASEVKEQLLRPAAPSSPSGTAPASPSSAAAAAPGTPPALPSRTARAGATAGVAAAANAAAGAADLPHHSLLLELLAQEAGCAPQDIVDVELQLCDTQPSAVGGALQEFIFSGRLDNLCSSWQGLRALIDSCEGPTSPSNAAAGSCLASDSCCRVLALFDHEEVGSASAHGAGGTLLPDALRRITACAALRESGAAAAPADDSYDRALRKSFVISADMAHALHPNYADRHDAALGPMMHKGMVIKHNANQRYATNAVTGFLFREVGRRAGLPTQEFAVRSDTGCGSTIGPILSTLCGVRTVDVGSPQWSMHSCREVMGTDDAEYGYQHLKAAYESLMTVDAELAVDAVRRSC